MRREVVFNKASDTDSTAWRLFNTQFMIRIGYIYTLNSEDVEKYGAFSTGDADEDVSLTNSYVVVGLTIPKMVEYYKESVPFFFTQNTDDRKIYKLIYEHIREWRAYMQNNVLCGEVPVDDLIALGDFASAVHAVRDRSKDKKADIWQLGDSVRTQGNFLPMSAELFRTKQEVKEEQQKQYDRPAEHMADIEAIERVLYGYTLGGVDGFNE